MAPPDLAGTELTAVHLRPPRQWESNLNNNNYNKKEKYEKSYIMHRIRVGRTVRVGPSVANHYHDHHNGGRRHH
jgi:hypothetical protein